MQFSKVHGQGNDFVIVNGFKETIKNYSEMAIEICDRHYGIGADGLVIILPSDKADFRMRIFNSDGSEAEMCGNVTRCVARYVYEYGLTQKKKITLETLAGIIVPELVFKENKIITVRVDMGEPRLKRSLIPMAGDPEEIAVNVPIVLPEHTYYVTCVSMGNPHCVIFVEDLTNIDLALIGCKIENHSLFPKKTNVEFVEVISETELKMRVWERGAGITLACGTGASAVTVAGVLNEKTARKVLIHLDGGDLEVEWNQDNHVYMSGPGVEVFRGEYLRK